MITHVKTALSIIQLIQNFTTMQRLYISRTLVIFTKIAIILTNICQLVCFRKKLDVTPISFQFVRECLGRGRLLIKQISAVILQQ